MSTRRASFASALLAVALGAGAVGLAHVRLRHPGTGANLHWPFPGNIGVVISPKGSSDLLPGEHEPALRNAIEAWNMASGQTARIVEDASAAARARTDWESFDLHLVFFDEEDQTGFFPPGSGAVAITPIWFLPTGAIVDADVVFNGGEFQFTTSGQPLRFDVQDVATHELGHFLGLDHSGFVGSTMYPFVDPDVLLHRSLSWDEVNALREAYPALAHAEVRGTVRRAADESTVAGAHVVALDAAGRTRSATLTDVEGAFALRGLSGGTYQVYATPLDEPVSAFHLGPGWAVQTDFQSTHYGMVTVAAGQTLDIGSLRVDPDVSLSLGRGSDRLPLRGIAGATRSYSLSGTGLVPGSTLAASDPSVTVTPTTWTGTRVDFNIAVPAGAQPGHFDLAVTGPVGGRSFLVAAVEVTPPDPVVDLVTPSQGPPEGGTLVTLKGANFRAGARVVLGREVYVDGQEGGAEVIDDTTITLTTRDSLPGIFDVVVIDASGVEGRKVSGFHFVSVPEITSVFPAAGSALGGTPVVVRGSGFAPDAVVRIGGVPQTIVSYAPDELRIATKPAGLIGGAPVLEVQNPDGMMAMGAFAYVAAPDPQLSSVAPDKVGSKGGTVVTIRGSELRAGLQVLFGADPATGAGGVPAAAVEFVDESTLYVTTPAHEPGLASVIVIDGDTGQAAAMPAALRFQSRSGGGCSAVPVDRTTDPMDAFTALLGLGLLALAVRGRQYGVRTTSAHPSPSS